MFSFHDATFWGKPSWRRSSRLSCCIRNVLGAQYSICGAAVFLLYSVCCFHPALYLPWMCTTLYPNHYFFFVWCYFTARLDKHKFPHHTGVQPHFITYIAFMCLKLSTVLTFLNTSRLTNIFTCLWPDFHIWGEDYGGGVTGKKPVFL